MRQLRQPLSKLKTSEQMQKSLRGSWPTSFAKASVGERRETSPDVERT